MSDERYEVKDPQIEALLRRLATNLAQSMPKGWGFALEIFSFGPDGAFFFISNAERETMIKALQEFINREKPQ